MSQWPIYPVPQPPVAKTNPSLLIPITLAVGGTTFNQAMTASVVTDTATMVRSVGKGLIASAVVSVATLVKSVNKALTADVVTSATTMIQGLAFILTMTATAVVAAATMTAKPTFAVAMAAAAVAATATLVATFQAGVGAVAKTAWREMMDLMRFWRRRLHTPQALCSDRNTELADVHMVKAPDTPHNPTIQKPRQN